jgi:hypothetical protein
LRRRQPLAPTFSADPSSRLYASANSDGQIGIMKAEIGTILAAFRFHLSAFIFARRLRYSRLGLPHYRDENGH